MDSTFSISACKKHLALAIVFAFFALNSLSQTFSNTENVPCNTWDSGNAYTGFERPITVSGLPVLSSFEACGELTGTALRQVNLRIGSTGCRTNMSSYNARLISPSGTIIQLFQGFATTTVNIWCDISFRDDASLERVKDYSSTFQNNYNPFSVGYYRTEVADAFDAVLGEDPNGTWTLQIQENGTFELEFAAVELVFGTPITTFDGTSNANNSCSGAYCVDSYNPVIGTINGYSQNDPFYPASPVNGCAWNTGNNNSAWFSFTPTSSTAYISISGTLNTSGAGLYDIQPIVVAAPATCSVPTTVPTGGCPFSTLNNQGYTLAQGGGAINAYVNGISANCEFNLSGLTPNQEYYLYIDGNGNACSNFYIEIIGNTIDCTPNGLLVDPTFASVAPICQGTVGPTLPTTSTNGITGTWSPSNTVSTSVAGTFDYVFVPSVGVCANVYHQSIQIVAQPSASITTTSNLTAISCTNPSLTLTATGGGTYSWANGLGSNAAITVSTPGTYTVTVSAGGTCNAVQSVVITNNTTPPTAAISNLTGSSSLTCTTTSVNLQASGGTSYAWSNGLGSNATATATTAGTYTVTVTGANGCTDTESITLTSNTTPPTAGITNNTGSSEITCVQPSVSLTATGGTSYSWSNGLGSAPTVSVSTAGTYTVTATAANGCTDTESITITSNGNLPTATITNNTNTTVLNCTNTAISVTGGGGVSYAWSNGLGNNASASITTPGTYTVTATAANGCSDTETITVTQNTTPPVAGITNNSNTTVLTCTNTSINVTGTGGTSYSWSNGLGSNAAATITSVGTYTVTATGANGCTDTETIVITQDGSVPTANINNNTGSTQITCTNPSISLTASGGGTYSWSNGLGNNASVSVNTAGTYTVTVTATNGCTATQSITVTQNTTAPTAGITNNSGGTVLSCLNPTISVTATGGSTYAWNNGLGNNAAANIINPGTYTVTVTAANGCTDTETITVTEDQLNPQAAIVNNSGSTVVSCTNPTISVTASGGVTYSWSNGLGNNATANITNGGTYTVTVTAANGCTDTESITITANTTPPTAGIINNTGETVITCLTPVINLTGTGNGAMAWSNGSAFANISVTTGNTYTLTVTAANGCTDTESIVIGQDNDGPVVGVAALENLSCENPISTLNNYNVTNATEWSADWTGPDGFDSSLNYPTTDEPGTYILTITDDNTGCETTVNITLAEDFPAEVLLADVLFPNVLSNNRDNKNFEWRPFLYYAPSVDIADVLTDYELFIFDRWGHEVFASSPGKTSWEPDDNIQAGVYYYVIRFSTKCPVSQPAERTGHIQVLSE